MENANEDFLGVVVNQTLGCSHAKFGRLVGKLIIKYIVTPNECWVYDKYKYTKKLIIISLKFIKSYDFKESTILIYQPEFITTINIDR